MQIRTMGTADLDFAAECTRREGWLSETRDLFDALYHHDPHGCFTAEADGDRIGICVAVSYGACGFVGELIVDPRYRGRGLGRRLLDHAIDYLRGCGARAIFLDGVPRAVALYERVGFRRVCRSLRFTGRPPGRSEPGVRAMQADDLATVASIDRRVFGADRRAFLEWRLRDHAPLCQVRVEAEQVVGYVMGRSWPQGCQAGPWVQNPTVAGPERLLHGIAGAAADRALVVGILETNQAAVHTVRRLGLTERPDPPWRMVLGEACAEAHDSWQWGIGSPAKG